MIGTSDIAEILYDDCKRHFQMPILLDPQRDKGEMQEERIVINSGKQTFGKIWIKSYANINICVPDEDNGESGQVRLQELEQMSRVVFHGGGSGERNGDTYVYTPDSIGIEEDRQMRCHYVNVRLLFKVLNKI